MRKKIEVVENMNKDAILSATDDKGQNKGKNPGKRPSKPKTNKDNRKDSRKCRFSQTQQSAEHMLSKPSCPRRHFEKETRLKPLQYRAKARKRAHVDFKTDI